MARTFHWLFRIRKILEPRKRTPALANGHPLPYRGRTYSLQISQDPSAKSGCQILDDQILVTLATEKLSVRTEREETHLELMLWYKQEARQELRQRMDFWAEQLGVSYRRMTISNPRRRWGSCNYRNDIRLNFRLIMLPPDLMDYVVAHELSHVVHKNHSSRFWNFLGTVMPDYRERRQRLRVWEKSNLL